MQFSINKEFANRYNTYRKKEELQKLKERYGDVELKIKDKKDDPDSNGDSATESSDSSTSSSDDDTNSSSAEREHEDFLLLYEALCKNDPQLNDPSKQWFRDAEDRSESDLATPTPSEVVGSNGTVSSETALDKQGFKKRKKKKSDRHNVVTLRDYDRQFLLEDGGLEEESQAVQAEKIAKLESDVLLDELDKSDTNKSKALFLQEADIALKRTGVKAANPLAVPEEPVAADFLVRRQPKSGENERKRSRKVEVDVDNLLFTDQPNSEGEAFLRDYIINQRWRRPSERVPTYSEVLRSANVDTEELEAVDASDEAVDMFSDNKILDEDDDFLIRVHDFERSQLESGAIKPPPKHRFQEEDKEFIKSYPRKIETSVHQVAASQARSSRSEKRKARQQRKLAEKKAKMAELDRLRRFKLSLYAEKIERIKRSCGAGCDLTVDLDEDGVNDGVGGAGREEAGEGNSKKKHFPDREKTSAKTALALAMHLDEDWDPEKHDQLLNRMFDDSYYATHEDPNQIPHYSDNDGDSVGDNSEADDSDISDAKEEDHNPLVKAISHNDKKVHLDQDSHMVGIENGLEKQEEGEAEFEKSRHRRRLRGKARLRRAVEREKDVYDPSVYPDFETYFQKYYKINCEDVLPGPTPDEDVFCHFKYRKVTPNDFGLSTEDVLTATPGELNSWVPIHRVTAYRTEDEEERDQRLFHSNHKLQKKTKVISSLNDPDAHWWPSSKAQSDSKSTTGSRRKRSKRKRKRTHEDTEHGAHEEVPHPIEPSIKPATKSEYRKFNGVSISATRLLASGLTTKDLHRARKRKHKSVPEHSELPSLSV